MLRIYGKPNCKFCVLAQTLARDKGLSFEYIDLTKDEESLDYFRSLGYKTVPIIYFNSEYVGGYSDLEKKLEEYLD